MLDFSDHRDFGGGGEPSGREHQVLNEAVESAILSYKFIGSMYQPCENCYPFRVSLIVFLDHFANLGSDQDFETACNAFMQSAKVNYEMINQKRNNANGNT